jgi:ABC-type nickel/cobalt efflux system permease component RcnA
VTTGTAMTIFQGISALMVVLVVAPLLSGSLRRS